MSNVLDNEKQQQVLALGRLGWTLRRIEAATGVRRETASGYLRAAGISVRGRGRPGEGVPKPAITTEMSTDSGPSKPAISEAVSTDAAVPEVTMTATRAFAFRVSKHCVSVAVSAVLVFIGGSVNGVWASSSEQPGALTDGQQSNARLKQYEASPETERRDQSVTEEDLRVLKRADEILSKPAAWNRHDTRICVPHDNTWSLFCSLQKAALDVFGQERYRAVALQEVRFAVEDLMNGMNVQFQHRMTDYNNLPSTRFADIKNVLKVATDRVAARLAAQKR